MTPYGSIGDPRSRNILATAETVNAITIDDLKAYDRANLSPSNARMHVVGALPKAAIARSLAGIGRDWKAKPVELTASPMASAAVPGKVYFVDVPDAKQSVLQVGYRALPVTDPDNVTLESTQLVKQILQDYPATYSAADLETTRNFLVKSNARAFETAAAKLAMLDNMSKYGWRADYVKEREQIVKAMTLPRMKALGFDEPVLIGQ
jgi:zinc protease